MTSIITVSILSDGNLDYWTVALDAPHTATRRVSQCLKNAYGLEGDLDKHMVSTAGSLGSRAILFPSDLIDSIRAIDGGQNVQRHFFDIVYFANKPYAPVIAIGSNQKIRRCAAILALACRQEYETEMIDMATNFFEDQQYNVSFQITRHCTEEPFREVALAIEDDIDEAGGVWREPLRENTSKSKRNKIH